MGEIKYRFSFAFIIIANTFIFLNIKSTAYTKVNAVLLGLHYKRIPAANVREKAITKEKSLDWEVLII